MFTRIVWATDGSPAADAAAGQARLLASPGARIVAVHATELMSGRGMALPARPDEARTLARIGAQVAALRADGFDAELVAERTPLPPGDLVAAVAADERAELILCGTRGHGSLAGALMESVSQRLIHLVDVPVLVVPAAAAREEVAA